MIFVGLFVYLLTFAVHFALLPRSGQGNAFMSTSFQKTLVDSSYHNDTTLRTPDFLDKFVELNMEMYGVNAHMDATHQYSSKWYTWPFMMRPIFYWQETAASTSTATTSLASSTTTVSTTVSPENSYIYLFGNPFTYWLGILVMVVLIVDCLWLLTRAFLSRNRKILKPVPIFIVIGFLANFLPFIFIGRVMFLYHYQAALVFTIIGIAYTLDQLKGRLKYILISATLLLALAAFIYWSPLTYGLPMTANQMAARMWFPSWR
jgi:dolichyl-phosphate-mannose--protein O-mannosyl transferase